MEQWANKLKTHKATKLPPQMKTGSNITHREAATRRKGGRGSRNHFNVVTCRPTPEQPVTHSVRAVLALESTVT